MTELDHVGSDEIGITQHDPIPFTQKTG